MAVHLRRPAFIEGTQCVELMRNLFITQGVVEPVIQIQELWDGQWNAASANVSFKQTSTESHQPKKSQLPIKSNANILGLGFYPVIINKDQFRIRTYLSKIPLDKAKNREKQIHLRNISLSQLEFLTRDSFTHKKRKMKSPWNPDIMLVSNGTIWFRKLASDFVSAKFLSAPS